MVKVKDNSKDVLAELQRKQLAFVTTAAEEVRSQAAARTPVATGNLRSSIQTEAFVDDGVAIGEVGPTADYAPYVELGTSRQEAQPYMEPGFQAARSRFRIIERMLEL